MNFASLRPLVVPLSAIAMCLVWSPRTDAAKNSRTFVEELVATAVSAPDAGGMIGGRIDITIERWSTDAERDSLRRTLDQKNPAALLAGLGKVFRRAGVVQMPGAHLVGARAYPPRAEFEVRAGDHYSNRPTGDSGHRPASGLR